MFYKKILLLLASLGLLIIPGEGFSHNEYRPLRQPWLRFDNNSGLKRVDSNKIEKYVAGQLVHVWEITDNFFLLTEDGSFVLAEDSSLILLD